MTLNPDSGASAYAAARRFTPGRRLAALVTVALAFVLELLDTTIVNVAIPSIRGGLGASHNQIEWIVAGYAVAFAVLLIVGGRLGDSHGYRRLFLCGVASFTVASLACGMAASSEALVWARLLQGGAAALMAPQVMALVQVMYAPHERFKVYAVFGVLGGIASALGPVVGGLLIDANWFGLGWRLTFLINLPLGLASLAAGALLLPEGRGEQAVRVDWSGALLSVVLLLALLVPLIEGPQLGWSWPLRLALAAVLPLGYGMWRYLHWRQARSGDALVPPALMGQRAYGLGLLCTLAVNPVLPGYLLLLTTTLQGGFGWSPTAMAYACLPIALGAMLSISVLGPRLHARLGVRTLLVGIGLTAAACATTAAALLDGPVDTVLLGIGQLGMGLGLGLSGPPLSNAALAGVPLHSAGAASGLLSAAQQVAGALGVALSGLIFFQSLVGGGAEAHAAAFGMALPLWGLLLALGTGCALAMPRSHAPGR